MTEAPRSDVECLECGQFFPGLITWSKHLRECVPFTALLTTAQLDAAYEKALEMQKPRSEG